MTNKEKAKEIANLCRHCIESSGNPCEGCMECESRGSYYGALEMGEQKDICHNETLNTIIDWFDYIRKIADDKTLNGQTLNDSEVLDEIKGFAVQCIKYIEKDFLGNDNR